MEASKKKIFKIISQVCGVVFIISLIMMLKDNRILRIASGIVMVLSAVLGIVFSLLSQYYTKSNSYNYKDSLSNEELKRVKENKKQLKEFSALSFNDQFKTFLKLIGVDVKKYEEETFSNKDGQKLTLSDINQANIKDFDWARFLAEKHELILIDANEDTLESLEKFEKYHDGFIKKYLRENKLFKLGYYREDMKVGDHERFEYAKDLKYFFRDICGKISCYRSSLVPMYIEMGDKNSFLFGIYTNPKRDGLDYDTTLKLRMLAETIGLYSVPAGASFPKTIRKPLKFKDSEGDGVLVEKNYYLESRNNKIIEELKVKKKELRKKMFEAYKAKAEPVTQNNNGFKGLPKGTKNGDNVEIYYFGRKHQLVIESRQKDDGELLDEQEIEELNWLISSNILDDVDIQFKILEGINESYDRWSDSDRFRTNIEKELDLTAIAVDIFEFNKDGKKVVSKQVAFCGECKCDEEHGISIAFDSRKFAGVGDYMDWQYIKEDNTSN